MTYEMLQWYFTWVFAPQLILGIVLGCLPSTGPRLKQLLNHIATSRWNSVSLVLVGSGLFVFPLLAWAVPSLQVWDPLVILIMLQGGAVHSILRWVLTDYDPKIDTLKTDPSSPSSARGVAE